MVSLKYSDLDMAVDFVSSGASLDASAYICRETGRIWYESDDSFEEEELPCDLGNTNKYVEVPDKREFDLAKFLVLRFASRELPEEYEEIDSIFRRSGAYSRFKDLLSEHGTLSMHGTSISNQPPRKLCVLGQKKKGLR